MIFVPLPFVVSLLLVIVCVQMVRRAEGPRGDLGPFVLLIAAYALQSLLIGLRWGYDIREVLPFQAVLACIIAAQAYLAFTTLVVGHEKKRPWQLLHFAPAALVAGLYLFWPPPLGLVIILTFLGHGFALLWSARRGPDALIAARLDGVVMSWRALLITACTLILSALTDMLISFDLAHFGGGHAPALISAVNLITLVALGLAATIAGPSQDGEEEPAPAITPEAEVFTGPDLSSAAPTAEDIAVARSVEELMETRALYRETELNLSRIARRLALPARRVSIAINRVHQMSVSQFVNNYRITEACRLLTETDEPVTRLMFECGFVSKSNFNREFLRVTGLSPTRWRQTHRTAPSGDMEHSDAA